MHQFGIKSSVLEQIISGTKTIEGRLARGKFLLISIGDTIRLREDVYDERGVEIATIPDKALVQVTGIARYKSFSDMLHEIGFESVLPDASSIDEAIALYNSFYDFEEQSKYGVLAFKFKLL